KSSERNKIRTKAYSTRLAPRCPRPFRVGKWHKTRELLKTDHIFFTSRSFILWHSQRGCPRYCYGGRNSRVVKQRIERARRSYGYNNYPASRSTTARIRIRRGSTAEGGDRSGAVATARSCRTNRQRTRI